MQTLMHIDALVDLIATGCPLLLAGEERLLAALPAGQWIGGTIPYFMGKEGGVIEQDQVFVTRVADPLGQAEIKVYDAASVREVYRQAPANGYSLILLPASSKVHLAFGEGAPEFPDFARQPLIGWIAGVHLDDLGTLTPKVFDGRDGSVLEDAAVVMSVPLPDDKVADIEIINIFEPGDGDEITFYQDGFSHTEVAVNGERRDFAAYCRDTNLDVQLPLVADYCGAMVNVSFQAVGDDQVDLYAPTFKGVSYRQAKAVDDYVSAFTKRVPEGAVAVFSCNCILNFLYAELLDKHTGALVGPFTFGEVAYQLLNQTLVYLSIDDAA